MNMFERKILLFILCLITCTSQSSAQSWWGFKGGATMGRQSWSGIETSSLWGYHASIYSEWPSSNEMSSFVLEGGYHLRGCSVKTLAYNSSGTLYQPDVDQFRFKNLGALLGFKKYYKFSGSTKYHILFGLRAEYTLGTNLDAFKEINDCYPIYPYSAFVKKFNYGFTLGGGINIPMDEYRDFTIELSLQPDASRQYFSPAVSNIKVPCFPTQSISLSERNIRNVSIELSVGLHFH